MQSHTRRCFWQQIQRLSNPISLYSIFYPCTTTWTEAFAACPHLLTHAVTNRNSANPRRPDLRNTVLVPLHQSSSPTSFVTFSPLRRYFIHLNLIYTSDLLVIWWYFAWFRSISTYNGWLMVRCLLLCLIFFFFFWCLGFRFFRLGVFISLMASGIGVHLRRRVVSARES